MKRRRVFVVLIGLLLLGAVINVAVAWGCARVHAAIDGELIPYQYPEHDNFIFFIDSRVGYEVVMPCERQGSVRDSQEAFEYVWPVWWESEAVFPHGSGLACGWPARSFSATQHYELVDDGSDTPIVNQIVHGGIPLPERQGRNGAFSIPGVLPFKPIWPGFAINTFFYAAIGWLVLVAPIQLRRQLRSRRGCCPACAYPIGANEVCTECGQCVSSSFC